MGAGAGANALLPLGNLFLIRDCLAQPYYAMGRCRREMGWREWEGEYIGHVSDKSQCTALAASMEVLLQTLGWGVAGPELLSSLISLILHT